MAEHHGHGREVHIQLVSHQLTQRGADAGAQIHVTVVGGDGAISANGDETVHHLGRRNGKSALGGGFRGCLGHQQMAARDGSDHEHATGLEQLATGKLGLIVFGEEFHDQAAFACVDAPAAGMAGLWP